MNSKPDFFIVGAPKCGTSSLANYLNQHPLIFIPEVKEPNFFGADITGPEYYNGIEEYLELFKDAKEKMCGEASTWYLFSKQAAKEIYEHNHEAKIITMLREPVSMLQSLHSQLVFNHMEDIEDFEMAIEAEADRKNGLRVPKDCIRPEALLYSEVVRYYEQVKRYFDVFGRENVKVIIFDDFRNNTLGVFDEVISFLGMQPGFKPDIKVINPSKKVKSKKVQKLAYDPPKLLKKINKILMPSFFKGKLTKQLVKMNVENNERPLIPQGLEIKLKRRFANDIISLEKLLERSLKDWK